MLEKVEAVFNLYYTCPADSGFGSNLESVPLGVL